MTFHDMKYPTYPKLIQIGPSFAFFAQASQAGQFGHEVLQLHGIHLQAIHLHGIHGIHTCRGDLWENLHRKPNKPWFSPSNIVVSEVSCSSFPSNPMSHGSDVWFNGLKTCRGSYVVLLKKFWGPVSLRSSKYDGKDYVQNRWCFFWCFRSLKSSGLLTSASPKLFFMLLPGGSVGMGPWCSKELVAMGCSSMAFIESI